jgi:NitT/TauT family transport system permease protein
MLGATRSQTLWRLKLPTGLPSVLAGLRIAVVLALVGAVVGEFIGASRGLGALIIAAQGSMDTALMFAVLVLISVARPAALPGHAAARAAPAASLHPTA